MREQIEHVAAGSILDAFDFNVGALQAVIRRAGQKKTRVSDQELFHLLGGENSRCQKQKETREHDPILQIRTPINRLLGSHQRPSRNPASNLSPACQTFPAPSVSTRSPACAWRRTASTALSMVPANCTSRCPKSRMRCARASPVTPPIGCSEAA